LRQKARRRVSRVWIRDQYSGDFAAAGIGTHDYPGQLIGGRRTGRDT
jgi:hypothetical protein